MPMSPYVKCLRAKVGNDLLHLPSVTVMLFDDDGRLLMLHWRDPMTRHEFWEPPGGLRESDETFEGALRRSPKRKTLRHFVPPVMVNFRRWRHKIPVKLSSRCRKVSSTKFWVRSAES